MNDQSKTLWRVAVERKMGKFTAKKDIVEPSQIIKTMEQGVGDSVVAVQIPEGARLSAAILSEHGILPPGITPFIGELANIVEAKRQSVTVVWLCLGFLTHKSDQSESGQSNNHPGAKNNENEVQNGNCITAAQKRFLFRLLARQNLKGEEAEDYLKSELNVDDLNDANRKETSELIDNLLNGGEAL